MRLATVVMRLINRDEFKYNVKKDERRKRYKDGEQPK